MQITKEALLAKRQLAEEARAQHLAQVNMQSGVIATCDNLLKMLEQPELPPVPAAPAQ
jgi:hypothetical protein